MRKSINQISSQISSDPPDTPNNGLPTEKSFDRFEKETRQEWAKKAQGVITQAKADTANIVEKYETTMRTRHFAQLKTIWDHLHSDLTPLNLELEKLFVQYLRLDSERQQVISKWQETQEKAAEGPGKEHKRVEIGLASVKQAEQKAAVGFDMMMGNRKRPRRTDETAVASDED